MNETIKLLNNRKSLRVYSDQPVTRENIDTIIQGAMRAPTAGNMMLYTILEVSRQEDKDRLIETCDDQPFIGKAPLVLIFLADMQRWEDYYKVSKVPEFCEANGKTYAKPQESDLMLACCDALIAAQQAVVVAESIGIGSCYIGDIMENIETHRKMFNLPNHVFPVTMLCFGYFKESYPAQTPRPRFDQKFIHFKDQYQRISPEGFREMFDHLERDSNNRFLENAKNFAQHHYLRKTDADFSEEMRRSVKVALKDWVK
jgi:nitroreductase